MIIRKNRISSFVAVILVIAFSLGIISSCSVQKDVSKGLVYDEALNFWYSEKEEYKGLVGIMRKGCSDSPEIRGTYILATDDDVIFIGGVNSRETGSNTPVNSYSTYESVSLT